MNLYLIRTIILLFFFSGCSPKKNQFNNAFEIAKSMLVIDDIKEGTYFLIMPEGKGCEVCNVHFVSGFKELGNKENLIIITNNFSLPSLKNHYLDTADKLKNTDLGFLGTALLVKKNNQFEMILTLNANTINKLDSIVNLIK